jgi:hypothetical protein
MLALLGQGNRGFFVAHADFQVRAAGADRQIAIAQPADEIKRLARRLLAGQTQRVGRDVCLDHRTHLRRRAEEAIRRRQTVKGLMRTLEVVVLDKKPNAPLTVIEIRKDRAG